MRPYSYYSSLSVEPPRKEDYTVKYYYRKGKLICVRRPFCEIGEAPVDAVEEIVFDAESYELHKEAWLSEKKRLEEEFRNDLISEEGLTPSERANKCFSLAWDYGCAGGHKEVHDYFAELSQLLK